MSIFRLSLLLLVVALIAWVVAAWARITHQAFAPVLWPVARWAVGLALFFLLAVGVAGALRKK
ncbi:MAG: hypothetical protein U0X40_09660 [Ferruginibacter sp.]